MVAVGACGNNALIDKGGQCYQSIDCQLGLACVRVGDAATGTCTDDLSMIQNVPEAGADMTAMDTTVTDTTPDMVVQDTTVQDTSTQDTATQDTSTADVSSMDAGGG
jgi:hypothetical protein